MGQELHPWAPSAPTRTCRVQVEQRLRVLGDVRVQTTAQAPVRGHGDRDVAPPDHACVPTPWMLAPASGFSATECPGRASRPTWVVPEQAHEGVHNAAGLLHCNLRVLHLRGGHHLHGLGNLPNVLNSPDTLLNCKQKISLRQAELCRRFSACAGATRTGLIGGMANTVRNEGTA